MNKKEVFTEEQKNKIIQSTIQIRETILNKWIPLLPLDENTQKLRSSLLESTDVTEIIDISTVIINKVFEYYEQKGSH